MASVVRSETDLLDFVDTAAIGLHWVAADGTILWANPADYEPLGYTEDQYVGHSITEFHADGDAIQDILRRLKAGERLHNYEARLKCRDGSTRSVLITSSVRHDEHGEFVHTRCFTVDVSDRRPQGVELQVEALNREVERLRVLASRERGLVDAILTQSPYGIIVSDAAGQLTLHNKAAESIWAGSATAGSVAEWAKYRAFHGDGRPYDAQDWGMARALAHRQVVEPAEIRIERFDGSRGFLLGGAAPIFRADGELDGAVSMFTDITKFKLQEDRRRFLVDAGALLASSLEYGRTLATVARLAVPGIADWCTVDIAQPGGVLERVAVAHVDPSKVRWVEELEKRYPADAQTAVGAHEVVRSGKPQLIHEIPDQLLIQSALDDDHLRLIRELGLRSAMIVPLSCRGRTLGAITFVSAESRRIFGADDLTFAEELSNIAALALDNARLYHEAQQANRAKDEFLATVSHELRTPLNAMLGWATLLRTRNLSEAKREQALLTIERNARAQSQLIEDLLDVSRIISGKLRVEPRSVDLGAIVEAAADSVRPLADAKSVSIQLQLADDARHALGDPYRLQQVVWNLLSNAVKFSIERGSVMVVLRRIDAQAEIEVRDQGIGIEPQFLPQIFDRFKQANGATTRSHGGLGLGLAIVRHLVELHDGTISADSSGLNQGSTFRVRLPLSGFQSVQTDVPSTDSRGVAAPRLDGLRVLVVDDEPDARALLTAVLEGHGAVVTVASSVDAALREVQKQLPDVLVSDIGMPGEDGYALIRKLRGSIDPGVRALPAAALTAFARMEDRTRAMYAGFQSHVAKPIDPDQLLMVVAILARRTGGG